jgi:DNA-directed RNA polymerase specialized sigma subunit
VPSSKPLSEETNSSSSGCFARYQHLLDVHASRFYLPGGDADDIAQEARIGFMKAVRFHRGGRGSNFHTFAELCVAASSRARSPRRGG